MGGAPGIALMDTGHSYAGFTPYLTPQGNRSPSRGSFSRTRSRENVNGMQKTGAHCAVGLVLYLMRYGVWVRIASIACHGMVCA